jgi:hypothetical protein
MICPECSNMESESSKYCSECGYQLIYDDQSGKNKVTKNSLNIFTISVIIIFMIIAGLIVMQVIGQSNKENYTIDSDEVAVIVPNDKEEVDIPREVQKSVQTGLVTVESTQIIIQHAEHKSLYPDLIEVVIRNNHNQTIKEYTVGLMGFDRNGYPLKIEWNIDFSGGDYIKFGFSEDANVTPGDTAGKDGGWGLDKDHKIHYVLAEISEVEFYDGFFWVNPDFDKWREKFAEKPLPENYRK